MIVDDYQRRPEEYHDGARQSRALSLHAKSGRPALGISKTVARSATRMVHTKTVDAR